MKEKPLATSIMLLGGATACICCIIRRAGLLRTLTFTLISLIVFMIIGLIAQKLYFDPKKEVEEQEKERNEEEERLMRLAEEEAEEKRREEEERLLREQQEKENSEETVEPDDDWGNDEAEGDTQGEEL